MNKNLHQKTYTRLSIFLLFSFLYFTPTYSQCGQVEVGSFTATSETTDGGLTCNWTVTFIVNNGSGSGNSSLTYGLVADDQGNGTMTTVNEVFSVDGVCDEEGVNAAGRTVTEIYNGSCDVIFNLEWEGRSSPNCNGNNCNSGSETTSVPTPVDLVDFSGVSNERSVELKWTTASEENNHLFEVQRSTDGRDFDNIGITEGNGTTNTTSDYLFIDKNPLPLSYYRLKQVDYNGDFEYSDIISIKTEMNSGALFTLAPALAFNEISVLFTDEVFGGNRNIEVYNVNGIHVQSALIEEGSFMTTIDISDLEPGMYFVRTIVNRNYKVKKFIKVSN